MTQTTIPAGTPIKAAYENQPALRKHVEATAARIKQQWHLDLMLHTRPGSADDEMKRQQIAALAARRWVEAGLDPNLAEAPKAREGVEPFEIPVAEQTPPPAYTGPKLTEIDAELRAVDAARVVNAETMQRTKQLRNLRTAAYQAATEDERREAAHADRVAREREGIR